jgi:hypothetical protein
VQHRSRHPHYLAVFSGGFETGTEVVGGRDQTGVINVGEQRRSQFADQPVNALGIRVFVEIEVNPPESGIEARRFLEVDFLTGLRRTSLEEPVPEIYRNPFSSFLVRFFGGVFTALAGERVAVADEPERIVLAGSRRYELIRHSFIASKSCW